MSKEGVGESWRPEHHRGRRPGVWAPGEVLVIAWGPRPACISSAPWRRSVAGALSALPKTRRQPRP